MNSYWRLIIEEGVEIYSEKLVGENSGRSQLNTGDKAAKMEEHYPFLSVILVYMLKMFLLDKMGGPFCLY